MHGRLIISCTQENVMDTVKRLKIVKVVSTRKTKPDVALSTRPAVKTKHVPVAHVS